MSERASPRLKTRKEPKQARSAGLVTAILQAATQVLAEVGAQRFTTARVAERAGVSVGSLYQYFPNKAAILFRLQGEEWQDTAALLRNILEDRTTRPTDRLRTAVRAFVRSECVEAAMRLALRDAAPLYRGAPEAEAAHDSGTRTMQAFLLEIFPDLPEVRRERAGDMIAITLSAAGERISERFHEDDEIAAYAEELADMLCAYLEQLRDQSDR